MADRAPLTPDPARRSAGRRACGIGRTPARSALARESPAGDACPDAPPVPDLPQRQREETPEQHHAGRTAVARPVPSSSRSLRTRGESSVERAAAVVARRSPRGQRCDSPRHGSARARFSCGPPRCRGTRCGRVALAELVHATPRLRRPMFVCRTSRGAADRRSLRRFCLTVRGSAFSRVRLHWAPPPRSRRQALSLAIRLRCGGAAMGWRCTPGSAERGPRGNSPRFSGRPPFSRLERRARPRINRPLLPPQASLSGSAPDLRSGGGLRRFERTSEETPGPLPLIEHSSSACSKQISAAPLHRAPAVGFSDLAHAVRCAAARRDAHVIVVRVAQRRLASTHDLGSRRSTGRRLSCGSVQ